MKRKILLIPLALLLVISLVAIGCAKPAPAPAPAPAPVPAEVFKWKFQTPQAPLSALPGLPERTAHLMDMVREATDGRIDIELYWCGALVPADGMLDALREGVLDTALLCPAYWKGTIPMAAVPILPFAYRSWEDVMHVSWDLGVEDLMREAYAEHNVYLVAEHTIAWYNMISTKPIRTLADMKGLKVRGFGVFLDLIEAWGGSTVFVALPEVYTALSLGTIEAVITAPGNFRDLKLYEAAKYVTPQPFAFSQDSICVNSDNWKALPDDLKLILTLVVRDWSNWILRTYAPAETYKSMDLLVEKGCTLVPIPDDEWAKLVEPAQDAWDEIGAGSPRAAKGIAIITDYLRSQGYID